MHTFVLKSNSTKKSLTLGLAFLMVLATKVNGQDPFITSWVTTPADQTITLPVDNNYDYDYDVDWNNDGVYDSLGVTGAITHAYVTADTMTIRIRGSYPAIKFNLSPHKENLISVDQWGSQVWQTMSSAFSGCTNVHINAIDAPDLSQVSSIGNMFKDCASLNESIAHWDVSNVTQMQGLFWGATNFDQPLETWDVSNVVNTSIMFHHASSFNQPLEAWDVSNVTFMSFMFADANAFNQPLGGWDTDSVISMLAMFQNATAFNQNLAAWDISSVVLMGTMLNFTNMSVSNYDSTLMGWANLAPGETAIPINVELGVTGLQYCISNPLRLKLIQDYNWQIQGDSPLCNDHFVTTWITQEDNTDIEIHIDSNLTYNYNIDWDNDGNWDDVNVTVPIDMDYGIIDTFTIRISGDFPRILIGTSDDRMLLKSVDQWGTQAWNSMEDAFNDCQNLIGIPRDTPDLSLVTSLKHAFRSCLPMKGNVSGWDVSNVTDMSDAFYNCYEFEGHGVETWDVSNVTTLWQTFAYCFAFNGNVTEWDVSNVEYMYRTFYRGSAFDRNLGGWDISSVLMMVSMLRESSMSTENYDSTLMGWNKLDPGETQIPSGINFDAQPLRFCLAGAARDSLDAIYGWTISDEGLACPEDIILDWKIKANDADQLVTVPTFPGETYLYDVDWDNDGSFDTLGVTGDFTYDYGSTGTYRMRIRGTFPRFYFNGRAEGTKLHDVVQWGIGQWSSMAHAFEGCGYLEVDTAFGAPDLSMVTDMTCMFKGSIGVGSLEWDLINVQTFDSMFADVLVVPQELPEFNISSAQSMLGMFSGTLMMTEQYDSLIIGWSRLDPGEYQIPPNMIFNGGPNNHCASLTAKNNLESSYGWTITDDGYFCGTKWYPSFLIAEVLYAGLELDVVQGFLDANSWTASTLWTNGAPDTTTDVKISKVPSLVEPRISGVGSCKTLELQEEAELRILSGGELHVVGEE